MFEFLKIALPIIIAFLSNNLITENHPLKFEHITVEDGLSQNSVECIFQDSKGFMWFGTHDGLNRYDGYRFKLYASNPRDTTSISDIFVQAIYEDSRGALWIGTRDGGLNKLDRATNRFERYKHDPQDPHTLSDNNVTVIHEDQSGVLWVGTGGGLNRLNPDTGQFTRFLYNPDNPAPSRNYCIAAISEDGDGNLWLGTYGGWINIFNLATETIERTIFAPKDGAEYNNFRVCSLYLDLAGILWIGTNRGLLRLHQKERLEILAGGQPDEFFVGKMHPAVCAITEDGDGVLWFGGADGLFTLDRDRERITQWAHDPSDPFSFSSSGLLSIYKDRSGLVWIGTNGRGINKLSRSRQHFKSFAYDPLAPNSLKSRSIRAIHEDKEGALWVGGYGGLDKLVPSTGPRQAHSRSDSLNLRYAEGFDRITYKFTHYQPVPGDPGSLSGTAVWLIYPDPANDGDTFWIGTEGGGLNRFDRRKETFLHYKHSPGNPRGLSSNFIYSVYRDRSGGLWVGTDTQLHKFDQVSQEFIRYTPSPVNPQSSLGKYILAIYEAPSQPGVLWLATENGLKRLVPETKQLTQFVNDPKDSLSISHNSVTCIYEDRAGRLWLGTNGGGLNRLVLEPGEKATPDDTAAVNVTFIHYITEDGLPNNVIYGILEDDAGNLWLSTNKGLSRFDPRSETFTNFNVLDGLQGNEFNKGAYYKCPHAEMFFGGVNGLNSFHPDDIKSNPHIPPIILTDFKIFNQSVVARANLAGTGPFQKDISRPEISLSYTDKVISFEFAALDYTVPEKNLYAYKMEGFDQNWVDSGTKREAVYTNLAPGEYVFRVKGSNNDGLWNEEGTALRIIVTPPFWRTWWFRFLSLMGIVSLLLTAFLIRARNIKTGMEKEIAQHREAEQQFRALLGSAPDAMVVTSKDGKILLINTQAEKLFGYSREEIVEKSIEILLPAQFRGNHCKQRFDYFSVPKARPMGTGLELNGLHKDGSEIPVEISLSPLQTKNGMVITAAIRDTSEKKRVADRQALLLEQLKSANEDLQHFAHIVSHDLKAPLRAIGTIASWMSTDYQDKLDANGNKQLNLLVARVKRMYALIDGLLQYSKAGRLEEQKNEVDFNRLVMEAIEMLDPPQNITIMVENELPSVLCTLTSARQTVQNLIDNAIKFMDKPQGEIKIGCVEDSGFWKFHVADNGPGIEKRYFEKIFEVFQTLQPRDEFESTGIGLSVVQKFVKKHGGKVWVDSQVGHGSAFYFTLPLH